MWLEKKLAIKIRRSPINEYFTWLMLADALEGIRIFFDNLQGWFESRVAILDDTAGLVAEGMIYDWS